MNTLPCCCLLINGSCYINVNFSFQLSAIVVTGLIADQLHVSIKGIDLCVFGLNVDISNYTYSSDKNACRYGTAIGVITMIYAIIFIVIDILLHRGMGSPVNKKLVSIADLVCSCLLALLWEVAFFYLLLKWNETGPKNSSLINSDKETQAGATMAFSCIGGIIWVITSTTIKVC